LERKYEEGKEMGREGVETETPNDLLK